MTVVLHERSGPVFRITINRPDRRNALNPEVVAGLAEGYRAAQADAAVRVVVLTGAGDRAFCAGGDLRLGEAFSFDLANPNSAYADLLRLARDCPLPTVARINGACMAGGVGLACVSDLAIAAEHAQFGLPEVRIGLFPFQVLALLKEQLGARVLRDLALTGRSFGAAEARDIGLVNEVAPADALDARVDELARRLAANSPTAIRRGKYALRAIESMSFEQAMAFAESQLPLMAQTEDAREGMASFNEKRDPRWTGR